MVSHSKLANTNGGHLTEKGRWACVFHHQHLKSFCAVGRLVGVKDTTVESASGLGSFESASGPYYNYNYTTTSTTITTITNLLLLTYYYY